MNRQTYFLKLIPLTVLFISLIMFLITWFFRDVGNMGWLNKVLPVSTVSFIWVLCITFLIQSRIKQLCKSKHWLILPYLITLLVAFIPLLYILCSSRECFNLSIILFSYYLLPLLILFIIYSLSVGFFQDINYENEKVGVPYKRKIIVAAILIYVSLGFTLLNFPIKTSGSDISINLQAMGVSCYNAEYINIFLFKISKEQHCTGGI